MPEIKKSIAACIERSQTWTALHRVWHTKWLVGAIAASMTYACVSALQHQGPSSPADAGNTRSDLFSVAEGETKGPLGEVIGIAMMTLEDDHFDVQILRGHPSVWIFGQPEAKSDIRYPEALARRERLRALLDRSPPPFSIVEIHHHERSAESAPRRDRVGYHHLWDPKSAGALALGVPEFPYALLVDEDLVIRAVIDAQTLASVDWATAIERAFAEPNWK